MKKDREKRNDSLLVACIFYAAVKDNFMKAAKEQAKESLSTEIDEGMESLLGAAFKIGFAEAIDCFTTVHKRPGQDPELYHQHHSCRHSRS